jgi:threonine 3-dehydrogenase
MKALVKSRAEAGLWMEDVPMPAVGDNDLLIKVKKIAICGTDVHIWKWDAWARKTIRVGQTVGHEFVGEIVEKGTSSAVSAAPAGRASATSAPIQSALA